MKLGDMPAFPCDDADSQWDIQSQTTKVTYFRGMTLRQYYAGLAMQGILNSGEYADPEGCAEGAIMCADALLAALEKQP